MNFKGQGIKGNLYVCLIYHLTMKTYGRVDVQLHGLVPWLLHERKQVLTYGQEPSVHAVGLLRC
jgi:VanZ family protein